MGEITRKESYYANAMTHGTAGGGTKKLLGSIAPQMTRLESIKIKQSNNFEENVSSIPKEEVLRKM